MSDDFVIENGVLKKYRGSATEVVIPNGVTEIGESAFKDCADLTSITIPDSVTKIGRSAFESCTGLTSIIIPDSVTEIGLSAFEDCASLASIIMPDGLTEIGESVFEDCESLSSITIPDSVTKIGRRAFTYCTSLTSITIPDSVTEIGDRAFYNCESLSSITIPDSVKVIGVCSEFRDFAFCNCPKLTIICPENSNAHRYCVEQPLPFLFDYQFKAFGGVIPPGIEKLASPFRADEEEPFIFISYSHKDREAVLTIIKTLYESGWRIWYDEGLTIGDSYDAVLEAHVQNCAAFLLFVTQHVPGSAYISQYEIPWAAAYGKPIIRCDLDEGVNFEIPEGSIVAAVTRTGIETALAQIDGLKKGEKRDAKGISVVIDSAARRDNGRNGFAYCLYAKPSAWSVLLKAKQNGCRLYDAVENGEDADKLQSSVCILAFIDHDFLSDTHLTQTLIRAFHAGKEIAACQLEEIEDFDLPAELVALHRLHWLDFAHGFTPDMHARLAQYLQERGCADASILPGFDSKKTDAGIVITRYTGFDPEPRLEYAYDGIPLVEIAEGAFRNCRCLRRIAIPDSVTKIGDSAFEGCTSLDSITIPDSVTKIGGSAFEGCTSLTSITIPDNVTEIGWSAFKGCTSLTSITIPNSVKKIGWFAFLSCPSGASKVTPSLTIYGSRFSYARWYAFKHRIPFKAAKRKKGKKRSAK